MTENNEIELINLNCRIPDQVDDLINTVVTYSSNLIPGPDGKTKKNTPKKYVIGYFLWLGATTWLKKDGNEVFWEAAKEKYQRMTGKEWMHLYQRQGQNQEKVKESISTGLEMELDAILVPEE